MIHEICVNKPSRALNKLNCYSAWWYTSQFLIRMLITKRDWSNHIKLVTNTRVDCISTLYRDWLSSTSQHGDINPRQSSLKYCQSTSLRFSMSHLTEVSAETQNIQESQMEHQKKILAELQNNNKQKRLSNRSSFQQAVEIHIGCESTVDKFSLVLNRNSEFLYQRCECTPSDGTSHWWY